MISRRPTSYCKHLAIQGAKISATHDQCPIEVPKHIE